MADDNGSRNPRFKSEKFKGVPSVQSSKTGRRNWSNNEMMKVKSRTAGREKYEKPRLYVYQGQAQNWGIIAITTLCRFLFLTRFWDDKAKALLVYGLTDEKLHGKLAFGWQGGWKMHAIRRRAVPRRVNAIRLVSHLSLTWRKRDALGLMYNSNNFNIIIIN